MHTSAINLRLSSLFTSEDRTYYLVSWLLEGVKTGTYPFLVKQVAQGIEGRFMHEDYLLLACR
jgi:hypothetical protein